MGLRTEPRDLSVETPEERERGLRWLEAGALALAALGAVAPGARAAPPAPAVTRTAATRQAAVGRMLGHPSLDAATRRVLEREIGKLPAAVLDLLDRNGVQIALLAPGQSPVDSGVTRDVVLQRDFADIAGLSRQASAAARRTEDLYQGRLAAAGSTDAFFEEGLIAGEAEAVALAQAERRALLEERFDFARRAVQEATGGRVDLAPYAAGELTPGLVRQMAEEHGARTPEEVRQFADLVRSLNEGRAGAGSLEGPLPSPAEAAFVPAYHLVRTGDRVRLLSTHDWMSHHAWREGGVLAQYFYLGPANTVVLSPGAATEPGVVLHELGHAFEDALRELEPTRHAALQAARDRAWEQLAGQRDHPFWGSHFASTPAEMLAETFAVVHGGDARALREAAPEWVRAFEAALPGGARAARR